MPILTGSTVGGPLLQPADLDDFAGAPFSDALVLAAGESIRSGAGWHIAPSVTETVTVDSTFGPFLFLPTLFLTAVTAVRDVTDPDNPVTLDGWSSAPTVRFRAGCLRRNWSWPCGVLEVDIVHGYDMCPSDLMAVAAQLCREAKRGGEVARLVVGGVQRDFTGTAAPDAVARYTLPPRP